jgi:hypothetical protein
LPEFHFFDFRGAKHQREHRCGNRRNQCNFYIACSAVWQQHHSTSRTDCGTNTVSCDLCRPNRRKFAVSYRIDEPVNSIDLDYNHNYNNDKSGSVSAAEHSGSVHGSAAEHGSFYQHGTYSVSFQHDRNRAGSKRNGSV